MEEIQKKSPVWRWGKRVLMGRKLWTCDFAKCDEIAQWYRIWKGELLKLCTKHEAYLGRERFGKHLNLSDLDEDDIHYLEEKEERKEFEKGHPFEVMLSPLGDEKWKIKIVDRRTDEKREFIIKETNEKERLFEALTELEKRRSSTELSIDEYAKTLREGE